MLVGLIIIAVVLALVVVGQVALFIQVHNVTSVSVTTMKPPEPPRATGSGPEHQMIQNQASLGFGPLSPNVGFRR